MANHFKDYHAKINSNKTVILSDDELSLYSKTANNEGVSHEHSDWVSSEADLQDIAGVDTNVEEKERTILRDKEREQKAKNVTDNLSEK